MTTRKSVAKQVQSVIINANMSQAQRAENWLGVVNNMQVEGEKFAGKVRTWVAKTGMTIFTLADAKAFIPLYAKQWLTLNADTKSTKTPIEKRAEKAAQNKLAWLRRELRASDVKVEADARGGANNKAGNNGKPKTQGVGLGKWNEAMALILQHVPELTMELDRLALTKLLAKLETQHKAQITR
jgi:hypothetical protein